MNKIDLSQASFLSKNHPECHLSKLIEKKLKREQLREEFLNIIDPLYNEWQSEYSEGKYLLGNYAYGNEQFRNDNLLDVLVSGPIDSGKSVYLLHLITEILSYKQGSVAIFTPKLNSEYRNLENILYLTKELILIQDRNFTFYYTHISCD